MISRLLLFTSQYFVISLYENTVYDQMRLSAKSTIFHVLDDCIA